MVAVLVAVLVPELVAVSTPTVAVAVVVPVSLPHASAYVVVAVGLTVSVPDVVARAPLQPPEARHCSARVELHESVEVEPEAIVLGEAFSTTVGTCSGVVVASRTPTVAVAVVVPLSLPHART